MKILKITQQTDCILNGADKCSYVGPFMAREEHVTRRIFGQLSVCVVYVSAI